MPTYDFKCRNCDYDIELFLKMADYEKPTLEPCPSCGQIKVEQVLGPNALIDSVQLGIRKPDRTFQREVLGRMQKNIPQNKIGKGRFTIPGRV